MLSETVQLLARVGLCQPGGLSYKATPRASANSLHSHHLSKACFWLPRTLLVSRASLPVCLTLARPPGVPASLPAVCCVFLISSCLWNLQKKSVGLARGQAPYRPHLLSLGLRVCLSLHLSLSVS